MSKQQNDNQEKLKALQLTLDKIEKGYGKGTIMKLSDDQIMDGPAADDAQHAHDDREAD